MHFLVLSLTLRPQVEWVEQGQGTGAMVAAANAGHVDVIVALTEGLIAGLVLSKQLFSGALH